MMGDWLSLSVPHTQCGPHCVSLQLILTKKQKNGCHIEYNSDTWIGRAFEARIFYGSGSSWSATRESWVPEFQNAMKRTPNTTLSHTKYMGFLRWDSMS